MVLHFVAVGDLLPLGQVMDGVARMNSPAEMDLFPLGQEMDGRGEFSRFPWGRGCMVCLG